MDWTDEYRAKVRDFMERKGQPMEIESDRPYRRVSPYGWTDFQAAKHTLPLTGDGYGEGCSWVVPEGAILTEHTYSMFAGTFTGNDDEVGAEVTPVSCKCEKYTDVTLRWVGGITEMLHDVLGITHQEEIRL